MFQLPSPLQKIENELTRKFNIHLFLKRDDLIHSEISGNKWRKLKYNLEAAKRENKDTILTFGGAYSNHITATAAAGKYLGLRTIGIIRGEKYQPLNKSLQFAKDCGMQLHYVNRTDYKLFNIQHSLLNIDENKVFILPEGGANELAIRGCAEITNEIDVDFDYIVSACGTGTTIAGIASNLKTNQKAIGIAVLKHDKISDEIIQKYDIQHSSFNIHHYSFNGYAKTTPELIQFIKNFYFEHHVLLDYVYTGKMMYGIFDLISKSYFPENSTIIAVHTGGVMNANVFTMV